MTFAEILREAMGDMSQADLADLTHIRQPTICRYLSGKATPRYEQLEILERALPKFRALRNKRDKVSV